VPLVGALRLWSKVSPLHGEGIRVGVIDTGIDYTHANFGGPGTVDAYTGNDKTIIEPGTFPTAKVVGGWDFAGADYDASSDATATPVPDFDPLDVEGHGSHVAGTIAGYGVTAGGATYAGPWDGTLDPTTLGIGPGAAPAASLYALKVDAVDDELIGMLESQGALRSP
jgi:minor extracellular serine protease Vpr